MSFLAEVEKCIDEISGAFETFDQPKRAITISILRAN